MYKKAWCTCKVVVLPILKPIAFSRRRCLSSLIFRNEGKNLVHQTLSANHAGKMFDIIACEQLAPPQAIAVHTDYTVAAGLIGWEVGKYSYVALYRWWPVHLVVRLLSHSPSIWCLDNVGRPSTKNQWECIYLGQYRPKSILRTVYMYVKLFHEISNFELHVVQWGKL